MGTGADVVVGSGTTSSVVVGSDSAVEVLDDVLDVLDVLEVLDDVLELVEVFVRVLVREVDDDVDDGVLVVSVGAGGTSTAGSAPASAHDEVPPAKTRAAARVTASRRFIGPTPPGRG